MHNFLWLDSKRTSDFWVVEHPPSLGEPPTTRNNLPWNPSPCAQHSSLKPELLTEGMGMWSEFVGVNYYGGNPKPSSRDEQNNTKHSLRGGVSRAAHLHAVWVMIVSTPTKLRTLQGWRSLSTQGLDTKKFCVEALSFRFFFWLRNFFVSRPCVERDRHPCSEHNSHVVSL